MLDREVIVVFKWMDSFRRRRRPDPVVLPSDADRDSGEEELESHEEEAEESAPSGMTRIKTDEI